MSEIAIRVENLSKLFKIGTAPVQYRTLRDTLSDAFAAPARMLKGGSFGEPKSTIWALKDVSFDIRKGQVVGVIGRNGAGSRGRCGLCRACRQHKQAA